MTRPDPHHTDHQDDDSRLDGQGDISAVDWRRIVEEVADAAVRVIGHDDGRPQTAWCLPSVAEIAHRYALGHTLAEEVREAAEEIDYLRHASGPGRRARTGGDPQESTPTDRPRPGPAGSTPDQSGVDPIHHRGIEGSTADRDATGQPRPTSSATEAVAGQIPHTPRSPARYRATGAAPTSLPDPATVAPQASGPGAADLPRAGTRPPAGSGSRAADRRRSGRSTPGPAVDRPRSGSGIEGRTKGPEPGPTPAPVRRPPVVRTGPVTPVRPRSDHPRTDGDRPRRPGMGKGKLVARPQDGSRARARIAAARSGDGRLPARQVVDLADLIHTALTAAHAIGMADADNLAGRRIAGQTHTDLAPERTAVRALWAALHDLQAAP